MPSLTLNENQIIDLIKQMPAKSQRKVVISIANEAKGEKEERMKFTESQIRRLCQEIGIKLDEMNEDEREEFIVTVVHEDRTCAQ